MIVIVVILTFHQNKRLHLYARINKTETNRLELHTYKIKYNNNSVYGLIVVPNNLINSASHFGWPGQAGDVTRFPSTTTSVGSTST